MKRLYTPPEPGMTKKRGAYWKGERALLIVRRRAKLHQAALQTKAAKKAARKKT